MRTETVILATVYSDSGDHLRLMPNQARPVISHQYCVCPQGVGRVICRGATSGLSIRVRCKRLLWGVGNPCSLGAKSWCTIWCTPRWQTIVIGMNPVGRSKPDKTKKTILNIP